MAADLLLGRERLTRSQVIKQADVVMLHHLVPDEVAYGSLQPNLEFYLPRTAHGSSLSPPVHAALLARAGEPDQALELFDLACRIDLDDLTGSTAGGLHLATMGGVWQALAFGFAGLWPTGGLLRVDPHLPQRWGQLELSFRWHGQRVGLRARHDGVELNCEAPLALELPGGRRMVLAPPGARLEGDQHQQVRT